MVVKSIKNKKKRNHFNEIQIFIYIISMSLLFCSVEIHLKTNKTARDENAQNISMFSLWNLELEK